MVLPNFYHVGKLPKCTATDSHLTLVKVWSTKSRSIIVLGHGSTLKNERKFRAIKFNHLVNVIMVSPRRRSSRFFSWNLLIFSPIMPRRPHFLAPLALLFPQPLWTDFTWNHPWPLWTFSASFLNSNFVHVLLFCDLWRQSSKDQPPRLLESF